MLLPSRLLSLSVLLLLACCLPLSAAQDDPPSDGSCEAVDVTQLPPGYAAGDCTTTSGARTPNGAKCTLQLDTGAWNVGGPAEGSVRWRIILLCKDGEYQYDYDPIEVDTSSGDGTIVVPPPGTGGNVDPDDGNNNGGGNTPPPSEGGNGQNPDGSCSIPTVPPNYGTGSCVGATLSNGATCQWVGGAATQTAGWVMELKCTNGVLSTEALSIDGNDLKGAASGAAHASSAAIAMLAIGAALAA